MTGDNFMRYPKFLPENGTIGFVAPSFGCATEPYYTAFLNAQKKFQKMGYGLDLGPNCYVAKGIGISNTPQACVYSLLLLLIPMKSFTFLGISNGII